MQLSLGTSLGLSVSLGETLTLSCSFGEHSGDIPLYSLHRICGMYRRNPPPVSEQLQEILKRRLFHANREYRRESGKKWNCLTSSNLVWAIDKVDEDVKQITTGPGAIPEGPNHDRFVKLFDEHRVKEIGKIQHWFEVNFNDLLYITDGRIPWAIIQRLQRNLGEWISSGDDPFHQGIEEMILDVAKANGINQPDDAEDAWQRLGGTLFK